MRIDISFDDGNILDRRVASILKRYGFNCTFYLPSHSLPELKDIYRELVKEEFEIGGHTVTHPSDMKELSEEDLCYEILGNKRDLELAFGRRITKFCYPRGRYNDTVKQLVKSAGYQEARTTKIGHTSTLIDDILEMPTTVHLYQRSEYKDLSIYDYAIKKFNEAFKKGNAGFFSLWGHSSELERDQNWSVFENILDYMNHKLSTISYGAKAPR